MSKDIHHFIRAEVYYNHSIMLVYYEDTFDTKRPYVYCAVEGDNILIHKLKDQQELNKIKEKHGGLFYLVGDKETDIFVCKYGNYKRLDPPKELIDILKRNIAPDKITKWVRRALLSISPPMKNFNRCLLDWLSREEAYK